MNTESMYTALGITPAVHRFGEEVLAGLRARFDEIDRVAEYNQCKVIGAMQKNRVDATHFAATTGYGYNDAGRDNLERVYADCFHTEAALVRPQITCGTHALTVALSANLLPGDTLLSPVGAPYDTLEEVIGIRESKCSLKEYGVSYRQVDLLPDGTFSPELWAMLSEEDQLKLTDAIASGLLNWTDEARKLIQLLTPCWKAAYEDGATVAGDAYGFVEIQRPEFVSAAKVNGGKRVVGIEQTTRDNIARIISRGISEGKSQIELKKEIQSEMGSTESRAKLIARQETSTALSTGQFDMMKAAGAATKTWHHRPQKNPRPDHVDMDGETVGIDQRFSNGLRFPRDPEDGRAEQLINCRCYLTYGGF